MHEIELKFSLEDPALLQDRLGRLDFVLVSEAVNEDTYYDHPCRDFRVSGEALRVRRENGVPCVTYKGAKSASSGSGVQVKAREELEWRLDPGDADGSRMETLLQRLSFRAVATVRKKRLTYRTSGRTEPILVTIDDVDGLGWYAEVETVLQDAEPSSVQIEAARDRVRQLAGELGLDRDEPRSYLRMHLEQAAGSPGDGSSNPAP